MEPETTWEDVFTCEGQTAFELIEAALEAWLPQEEDGTFEATTVEAHIPIFEDVEGVEVESFSKQLTIHGITGVDDLDEVNDEWLEVLDYVRGVLTSVMGFVMFRRLWRVLISLI